MWSTLFIYSRRRFFEAIDELPPPMLLELADFGYECNTELGYESPVNFSLRTDTPHI